MTKTSRDVVDIALRRIGVLSVGEEAAAEDHALAVDILGVKFDELKTVEGAVFSWGLDAVPDNMALPLGWYLAVDIAADFQRPLPELRAAAWLRVRKVLLLDDRENIFDADKDGILSDDEVAAERRAGFY